MQKGIFAKPKWVKRMYISSLNIFNFKNHTEQNFDFKNGITAFVGNNGIGKTNILDAIHYICLTKSYLNNIDQQNIAFEADFFSIQANLNTEIETIKLYCGLKRGERKIFKKNNKEYAKLAEHIGTIPVVVVSPYDTNIITEGSEERRKFIDNTLCQINSQYLQHLMAYQRLLLQRNALLKQNQQNPNAGYDMAMLYAQQMNMPAEYILKTRLSFFDKLNPYITKYYTHLFEGNETISNDYLALDSDKSFEEICLQNWPKDCAAHRTTDGIHKHDVEFLLNGKSLRKFASQGQQKTFIIALKLAQFNVLHEHHKKSPILLLDDIFDKLDHNRTQNLINAVAQQPFGQVFVTDTDADRVNSFFKQLNKTSTEIFSLN